ncbi:MAG: phosphotransferase [Acidobacteria bacterium]|nr:phosphotransferase [Acidobacteriota bacterium]
MSPGTADAGDEADWLCRLIEANADALTAARLGQAFGLGDATFRLHAIDRNTIYRVSARFNWFLKLQRAGDVQLMNRERLGADTIGHELGSRHDYGGARVIRVSTAPAFVLAATISGKPLNRALAIESWLPSSEAGARLEESFATLGSLLATLHANARLPPNAPEATKRPFATLRTRLDRVTSRDAVVDAIAAWYDAHRQPDQGGAFIHGNMRLDNVLRDGARIGFVDFEHCGSGQFYQDLARPVTHLLQVRAVIAFPQGRATRCLNAYLREYRAIHPYDPQQLNRFVGARLSRYYLETQKGGVLSTRIGGLPVARPKLSRMTIAVLQSGIESVVPGLSL